MIDIDYFRKINNTYGVNSKKEHEIQETKRYISMHFDDNIAHEEIKINGELEEGWIFGSSNVFNRNGELNLVLKPEKNLEAGKIIEWKDENWLVTEVDPNERFYNKGKIAQCHDSFMFYKEGVTPIAVEVPYAILDRIALTRMGISSTKYLDIPSGKMLIMIQNNDINKHIRRNNVYTLINNGIDENYKVIDINRVRTPGIMILELEWTMEQQILPQYSIEILNGDLTISQTQQLKLNIQVYKDDQPLPSPLPYSFISSNEDIAVVGEDNELEILNLGTVDITVMLDDDNSISDTIQIEIVEDEIDNFTIEVVGEDEIIVDYSENYIVKKYNNGVEMPSEFIFEVVNDIPISVYDLTVIDDNTCSITANQKGYKLILRAVDKNDNSLYIEKEISLITLF